MGPQTCDDGGVYRLTPDLALVQTVDFFTPVVDDPYLFGRIAAANALSDVYAMGGRPLTALNIAGFPKGKLDLDVLVAIFAGGSDTLAQAGCTLLGGHTIEDTEPKYGLAVTGVVHPDRVLTNRGARPGDLLVLTKPLGIGIITTAMKRELASAEIARRAIDVMCQLNDVPSKQALEFGARAATDITGFGLLGHALEMAEASRVGMTIYSSKVPVIDGTRSLVARGSVPGGTHCNLRHVEGRVSFADGVAAADRIILADAITSGGLLVSLPPENAEAYRAALEQQGLPDTAVIGRVEAWPAGQICVEP